MDTVITMYVDLREFRPMRVHMSCTTTLHVAVKTEHACRARHHYMHFTSQRYAVGIHIPRHRVVLEVDFSRPCGKAFTRARLESSRNNCLEIRAFFFNLRIVCEIIECYAMRKLII